MILRRCLPAMCLLLLSLPACAQRRPGLWLDAADVVLERNTERAFRFDAPEGSLAGGPVLWIAPRNVYPVEDNLRPSLALKVNGKPVTAERLLSGPPAYRTPSAGRYPIQEKAKCREVLGETRWEVQQDNNFTKGEVPVFHWSRGYAAENLEASYAMDLTGLVRPGENTLFVGHRFPDNWIIPTRDTVIPPNPDPPLYALHARFVRIGVIGKDRIDAYNRKHSVPLGPRLKPFGVLSKEGFAAMRRYYEAGAAAAREPVRRAALQYVHAVYEIWAGNMERAAELLRAARAARPADADLQARILFHLGLAELRTGNRTAADKTWERLVRDHGHTAWAEIARRERSLTDAGKDYRPINWPTIVATRANTKVVVDGRLAEAAWASAKGTSEFSLYGEPYLRPRARTEAKALYDDKYLYVGLACHEPRMAEVSNSRTKRDTPVWRDDCIEIFLDPGRTYAQMFEFELGARRGIVDVMNIWEFAYLGYDPERRDAVARGPDRWTVEMAIPWTALRTRPPSAGDVWLCNLVRNRPKSAHRPGEAMTFAPCVDRFGAHDRAAFLLFR